MIDVIKLVVTIIIKTIFVDKAEDKYHKRGSLQISFCDLNSECDKLFTSNTQLEKLLLGNDVHSQ